MDKIEENYGQDNPQNSGKFFQIYFLALNLK